MTYVMYGGAAWLLLAGCYGLVTSRHLVHTVVSLIVCQSSTYLVLLGVGYRKGGTAPVFGDRSPTKKVVDPVVQAMTLTDVVVSATIIALLLAITIQTHKRHGTVDPDELLSLRG